MPSNRFDIERIVRAPRDAVFASFTDHAGWTEWARVGRVRVVTRGRTEPDGEGCVRSFDLIGLHEEVVELRRPEVMAYRIVRGVVPFTEHRARITFEPHPEGTRIVWRTEFRSRLGVIGRATERVMGFAFGRVLARFATHVERAQRGGAGRAQQAR
jgi:uncharacterized protein YndB with AHSA1/START domain|nr:SRPBCC family protein [Kofleriaceae bacterium]